MVGSFPQSIYWLPEKEGLNKVTIYELCAHLKVLKLACLLLTLCNNILLDLFVCTVFFVAGTVPGNQICFFLQAYIQRIYGSLVYMGIPSLVCLKELNHISCKFSLYPI